MKDALWKFISDDGTFGSSSAHTVPTLYLPLANECVMSSITPTLHGDIKTDQDHFLLEPVSRIDLVNSRSSRNFWVRLTGDVAWSAAGVSKDRTLSRHDRFSMKAGLLWQEVQRMNRKVGLCASILSFVPSAKEQCEIMRVRLTNISRSGITFTPFAAIPLFARGAQSIRDHRHVTSLLQRITLLKYGMFTRPTLHFDECGHTPNQTLYYVIGWDEKGRPPEALYPTQEMFCGEAGDLEAPLAVLEDRMPDARPIQGREPMGALRFSRVTLAPGQSSSYIIFIGSGDNHLKINELRRRFRGLAQVDQALKQTRKQWLGLSRRIHIRSGSPDFDNWFHWVNIQPVLRRIYGCSFLPDFDYGKGGRGWRDLWQDCLGLILSDPAAVRQLLINNFSGVKIDGTNATVIGKLPGEFIADRNGIPRVWMDHGVWPLFTLNLYLQETADTRILFEKTGYFRDAHIRRCTDRDDAWTGRQGMRLLTRAGREYVGTIIEHLLVQHLVAFFHVGGHQCVLLEGADWNDGLDMAGQRGESAAFSCFYAHNLALLADILERLDADRFEIARELQLLLNARSYDSVHEKRRILSAYFLKVQPRMSGTKVWIAKETLITNLREKASWLKDRLRRQEWLSEGFFNGYYDNRGRRVEGRSRQGTRMMLASQVFPILSGVADAGQVGKAVASVNRFLRDPRTGCIHLNTDFKEECHHLGRAFSFAYGDKENGAYFNHMSVMYAYALYTRGLAVEGWDTLRSIYASACDSQRSRVYPCLPEYFDLSGRGMYAYLTGSASWFVLTVLTQVFGVRGSWGDLRIDPKFSSQQFPRHGKIRIIRTFAGRRFDIRFINSKKLSYATYSIERVELNNKPLGLTRDCAVLIKRSLIRSLPEHTTHELKIVLG